MSLVTIIDTNLVNNQLQSVFTAIQGGLAGIENSFLDIFPKAVQVFADNVAAQQADLFSQLMTAFREGAAAADFGTTLDPILDSARSLYGTYSKTMSVYNLPFNLMIPLTACIVPGISACLARRDGLGAQRITESAMRMAALIALPCGFGLMALGGPIMEVIALGNVDTGIAGPILSILGIASIFVCFQLVGTAILQANGIVNLPIITVIIGGVTKIVVNYTLVGQPQDHDLWRAGGHSVLLRGDLHPQPAHHQAGGAPSAPLSGGPGQAPAGLGDHGRRRLGQPRPALPGALRQPGQGYAGHRRGHPGGRGGLRRPGAGPAHADP